MKSAFVVVARCVASLFVLNHIAAVARAADPGPRIEIVEAKYGAGKQWKDVKPVIDRHRRQFFVFIDVSNQSMGGDPAPEVPKELVVRTRLGKTTAEQRFKENSPALIVAPSDPQVVKEYDAQARERLVVLEAKQVRGDRSDDWIAGVKAAVRGRELSAQSARGLSGKGSAMGGGRLVIVYLEGDQIRALSYGSTDRVQIPPAGQARADEKAPPAPAAPASPAPTAAAAAASDVPADAVVFEPITTPDPVTTFAMTPDGKYVVMAHHGTDALSVWDVAEAKILKTIKTPRPRSVLCTGDLVFAANEGKGTISVFSIADDWKQRDELKVDMPKVMYLSAAIGASFKNQVLATCDGDGDNDRGRAIFLIDAAKDTCRRVGTAAAATVSYDGRSVITQGSFNYSPSGGISVFPWDEFLGKKPKPVTATGDSIGYAYPAPRASYWITGASVYGGTPIAKLADGLGFMIVADVAQPVVYSFGDRVITAHRLDTQLTQVGKRPLAFPAEQTGAFHRIWQHVHRHRSMLLDRPVTCVLGEDLHLFAIDVEKQVLLRAKTRPFVLPDVVASSADPKADAPAGAADAPAPASDFGIPARVVAGKLLSVKLAAKSPGQRFELMTGPEGMKIAEGGTLTWTPDDKAVGVHTLKVRVRTGEAVAFVRPTIEVIGRALADAKGGSIDKVDEFARYELGPDHYTLTPSPGYRSLLLLQGSRLTVLKPDGITVDRTHELPARYSRIAQREDCFIALGSDPSALDVIDASTLKVRRRVELNYPGLTDLAIHPTKRVSYVAVEQREEPRCRVVVVDEASGDVTVPDGFLGRWVTVDPTGKTAITGYKDVYVAGRRVEIDPNLHVFTVPEYGSIDLLISYDVRGSRPKRVGVVNPAGGNGNGIRLSADGQRISYLSFVGFPEFSRDIAAWNPSDLKAKPVSFPCKANEAVCTEIAFHPTLKLAAVPGKGSAVIFDRETAQPQAGKLALTSTGLGGASVESLMFSPDGASLIFVCTAPGEPRYLRQVALNLSSAERSTLAKPPPRQPPAATQAARAPAAATPLKLAEIQALAKTKSAPMSAKEISKRFDAAVVLVTSGDSSGSGFVIGKGGYVLTSAHVVSDEDDVKVTCESPAAGTSGAAPLDAAVVYTDRELDVALLKVNAPKPLPVVVLAGGDALDAGEEVTVIGNPGAGEHILSHTVTTGVVSNPTRNIEGETLVQTSASVNPGSSGAPMFNGKGEVIGMVCLKANIEAAGFAIPSGRLREFLKAASEAQ